MNSKAGAGYLTFFKSPGKFPKTPISSSACLRIHLSFDAIVGVILCVFIATLLQMDRSSNMF